MKRNITYFTDKYETCITLLRRLLNYNFYNFSNIVESIGRNVGVAFFSAILLKPLRDLAVYTLDAKVHDPELFALTQEVAQFSKIPKIKQVWFPK